MKSLQLVLRLKIIPAHLPNVLIYQQFWQVILQCCQSGKKKCITRSIFTRNRMLQNISLFMTHFFLLIYSDLAKPYVAQCCDIHFGINRKGQKVMNKQHELKKEIVAISQILHCKIAEWLQLGKYQKTCKH